MTCYQDVCSSYTSLDDSRQAGCGGEGIALTRCDTGNVHRLTVSSSGSHQRLYPPSRKEKVHYVKRRLVEDVRQQQLLRGREGLPISRPREQSTSESSVNNSSGW